MKKITAIIMVLVLISIIVGCVKENELQSEILINVNNLNINENVKDDSLNNKEGEKNETADQSTENEVSEPEETTGSEGETTTGTGSETSTDLGETNPESEGTNTEEDNINTGENTEEIKEPVDYTIHIEKPYEDVDYTPQVKKTDFINNPKVLVKGVFVTANTAASSRIDEFIDLLNNTDLNALVIDVKNDDGFITFHSEAAEKYVPEANGKVQIADMTAFMQKLKDNNIYTIARIVTFKSPKYAKLYPERGIVYKNSGDLYYADGAYWASPFDQQLWQYNVEVAKEAIAYGFNEIQFDYVRFPATGSKVDQTLDFRNPDNHSKTYAVQAFSKYAYEEINKMEAYVALDVFGWTATTVNDSGIGQHWEGMSNVVDYMCPMVYPSHYGENIFGLAVPDANPYTTIYESMSDAIERNANIETPADLRPWLQAFTAKWVKGYIPYRKAEIQAQIKACRDLGIEEYIFWNASNNYTQSWFEGVE